MLFMAQKHQVALVMSQKHQLADKIKSTKNIKSAQPGVVACGNTHMLIL